MIVQSSEILLQFLHVIVDALHLLRDVDALRAMHLAFSTCDAMVRLPKFRHTAVISNEECTPSFPVICILGALGNVPLVETLIVVKKNCRNVDSDRAWHAVFAVITRDKVELHHFRRRILKELEIIGSQRLQWSERTDIVLKMLHPRHAAENSHYVGHTSGEPERP